jgi:hypothetical protein
MKLRVRRCAGVVVFGVVVLVAAPVRRACGENRGTAAVDLSGRWRLNKDLSDDEQAKEATAAEKGAQRQPPDRGSPGEPAGEGSEGGRGARRGGRGGPALGAVRPPSIDENDPRGAKRGASPPDVLSVTQVESEIVVEESPGLTRELYPNGKTYRTDEGATQIKTSWKDGTLVVERKNVRGWRLVETWELLPDRSRLLVRLLLEGGSRPRLSLKRVYDRVDARPLASPYPIGSFSKSEGSTQPEPGFSPRVNRS